MIFYSLRLFSSSLPFMRRTETETETRQINRNKGCEELIYFSFFQNVCKAWQSYYYCCCCLFCFCFSSFCCCFCCFSSCRCCSSSCCFALFSSLLCLSCSCHSSTNLVGKRKLQRSLNNHRPVNNKLVTELRCYGTGVYESKGRQYPMLVIGCHHNECR